MPHDPMTLAEFERQAERHLLIHVGQAQTRAEDAGCDLSDELEFAPVLRPFVLRLLAAERERCAREADALGDRVTADAIRNMEDPSDQ